MATIAAHERWARVPDRTLATAPARQAFEDRFVEAARLLHPNLSEDELLKRAANLRSAEAARMAYARWHKKAATTTDSAVTAREGGDPDVLDHIDNLAP